MPGVSWAIRNITDLEVLDAAMRLSGTIRWFNDGIDVEPPYVPILSTFSACFGPARHMYLGPRNRAYCSGRAILWIHTLAMYEQSTCPLPTTEYRDSEYSGLQQLLEDIRPMPPKSCFRLLPLSECTLSGSRWILNVLLH